jgi:hypothetical protein
VGAHEAEAGDDQVGFGDQVALDRDLEVGEAGEQLLVVLGDLLAKAAAEVLVDGRGIVLVLDLVNQLGDEVLVLLSRHLRSLRPARSAPCRPQQRG